VATIRPEPQKPVAGELETWFGLLASIENNMQADRRTQADFPVSIWLDERIGALAPINV